MRTTTALLCLILLVVPALAGEKADKRKAEKARKERQDALEDARKARKKRAKANKKTNEELGEKLNEVMKSFTDFSGAVLVVKDGMKILEQGYGLADRDNERANAADTLFDLGSLSKQFTAAAALKLETEGKLSTDDKLSKFWSDLPEDKREITVHQLLTHTGGLARKYDFGDVDSRDRDAVVRQLLKTPLAHEPGSAFEYSNSDYFILAAIIDKQTPKGFDEYLRESIFKPAELKSTGLTGDESLDRKKAAARYANGEQRGTSVDYGWHWGFRGATGVISTVGDLWLWTLALEDEEVLNFEAKEKLWKVEKKDYACGWEILKSPRDTRKIHHSGAAFGALAWYAWYPEDDVMIAVLLNDASDTQLHFRVADALEAAAVSK
ncbi:MAG: beta-lactamase family protein [Planctomycetes bacterium]|nr:beta-lactamase family protein [Planctomycetota bacterium]MCA8935725.1 beta-lactamase family protein [Planctomycetota bacterium]MCA8947683.1 beta-lactamase family protein [Planctomycetota bacterium]